MTRAGLYTFILVCLAFISAPAQADISALYETKATDEFERKLDFSMTVEVNADGDARLHVTGTSAYFLILNGEAYRIYRGIDGPFAEKLEDLEAAIANAGEAGGISLDLLGSFDFREVEETGEAVVGQWSGVGYASIEPKYEWDEELYGPEEEVEDTGPRTPELILSDSAELRPIGAAFGTLLKSEFGTLRAMSLIELFGGFGLYDEKVRELISQSTPIKLGSLELAEVSDVTIDPARFELPERVLTCAEIEAQTKPFDWAPAFDSQPQG